MAREKDGAVVLREPQASDGAAVWELVRRAGGLDVNSAYCYMMVCDYFKETCVVAEREKRIVGFVSAFRPPERPDDLFVWQIAVHPSQRGQGIATALLEELIRRQGRRRSGAWYMEATVAPSNAASRALFGKMAERYGTACEETAGYPGEWFPAETPHEEERRLRIGPFQTERGG